MHVFFEQLQSRLQAPLPGIKAHVEMAPADRIDIANRKMLYEPRADSKLSAVMILCYPKNDNIYFPLIIRPQNTGVHSGQVALPGGKKDEQDSSLSTTALRETEEELGIPATNPQIIGHLSDFYIPPSNFIVQPIVAVLEKSPVFKPSPSEVAQLVEVDLFQFYSQCHKQMRLIEAPYMQRQVPCYEVNQHIVWGATAVILGEFKSILADIWEKDNKI